MRNPLQLSEEAMTLSANDRETVGWPFSPPL
jgi:hypothetical protein